MGFKYKVEPSQEFFGAILGMTFLVFLGYMGISGLIDLIKEKFKSLDKKILDKIDYAKDAFGFDEDDDDVISGNDYPRTDWTDSKNGKHWEVDQKLRAQIIKDAREDGDNGQCDPLMAYGVVDIPQYMSLLKRYIEFLKYLTSVQIGNDTGKQIESKFNSYFKPTEVVMSKSGIDKVVIKTVDVQWPNHPAFKDPVQLVKILSGVQKYASASFDALAKRVRKCVDEPTDGASKEYLASKAAYLNFCNIAVDMFCEIADKFSFYTFTLNNDELFGSCLILKDKNGKDITDHH